jgi:hypothetical protein
MSDTRLTKRERRLMREKLRQTHNVRLYKRLLGILDCDRGVPSAAPLAGPRLIAFC